MPTFTFFWQHGERSVGYGATASDAFSKLGRGAGAVRAVVFYMPGDNNNYEFNNISKTWVRKPSSLEAMIEKMDRGEVQL